MNVMSYFSGNKINAKWDKINAQMTQLEISLVQSICELKNVII